ncbi:PTS system Galactitol-specific IIC component [Thermoanaerobacter mathranii subsp. mathranii str. A3]|uniref:PTS system Galactitol-specific IIC component n=1 Tax=Thermoanaerobacter mathranii subsp. mathranii (strain DSM 11426 / CCUG 53645 / CIP 108742 / A3) TaxID=583358 RepID=A0ABN3YZC4_THEM3|nr:MULTISPECIES: PTS transporter subunit IIC [Thermoanaerobacter]ADH59997.1 PTS system Galactitol-specific IIC component [Thermoanaerobacter mathranii subsp. mathranii str. A3]
MFAVLVKTFGAAVLLPIFILILELILGVKFSKAIRSALYIGIGLNGLISILNPYFLGAVGKAVSDMITTKGVHLPYVDTGWALLAAVGYSTKIGALIIPIGIGVNLIMLLLRWTNTLDLDIWNFWHWAFVGSMTYYATNNLWFGILAAVAIEIFLLVIADITAPTMQKFFNLPGLSFPHASGQGAVLLAPPFKWLFTKIGLTKLQISSRTVKEKFGILGDSVVIGFIISSIIGFLAWGNRLGDIQTWSQILTLGIGTGAYIYLYPKATGALLEGFVPLNERVRDILSRKGIQRELNFGMDSALTVGHPDVITTGLLTMITAVPLVFLLPGNKFLMLADLGVTPFFLASAVTAVMGGNIIASYITTVVGLIITLYISSAGSPLFFHTVTSLGISLPETGAAMVGADIRPLHGLFYFLGKTPIGLIVLYVSIFVILFSFKKNPTAWYRAFGYAEDGTSENR